MYEQFATVYDEMMEEIPYDEWFIKFQEILKEHGITSGHVCELGCGTGEMVSRFAKAGYEVTGIDISPDMLAKACEKTEGMEKISYFEEDMTDFSLHKPADVVLCICDSMNYLLSTEEIFAMFRCIKEALAEDGAAILLTIFTEDKASGMYARYDECHEQRAYTEDEIKSCLKETSLRLVKSWTEDEVRTYFVIQR